MRKISGAVDAEPGSCPPGTSGVIERAAYITPNEHEAAILFGDEPLGDVSRRYPNKLIVTEGKGSSLFRRPARGCRSRLQG